MNRWQCKQAIAWHKARGEKPYARIGVPVFGSYPIMFPTYTFTKGVREMRHHLKAAVDAMYDLGDAFVRTAQQMTNFTMNAAEAVIQIDPIDPMIGQPYPPLSPFKQVEEVEFDVTLTPEQLEGLEDAFRDRP